MQTGDSSGESSGKNNPTVSQLYQDIDLGLDVQLNLHDWLLEKPDQEVVSTWDHAQEQETQRTKYPTNQKTEQKPQGRL